MDSPADYSKYNSNPIRVTRDILSKYKDYLKWSENENILEVGCANGVVTKEVLYPLVENHVDTILAVDISQEAIDVANEIHGSEKISFRQMNIDATVGEEYKEKFNHIFTFSVLHLLKKPNIWSQNLYKMLKTKGQIFASVVILPHPYATITTAQREDKAASWAKSMEKCLDILVDYRPNPEEKLTEIFTKVGFKIDLIEMEESNTVFKNIEELNRFMLSINGFLKSIPTDLREAYIKDYLKRTQDVIERGEDGSYSFPKKLLIIIATKN